MLYNKRHKRDACARIGDILHLLNKSTKFTSLYSLGKILEDEKDYFILGHDQGNGAPYSFEFIDKQSGENILGYGVRYLDAWTKFNNDIYVMYVDTNNKDKKLTLFSYNTKHKEHYNLPDNYWELAFDTLTNDELTIKITLDKTGDSTKNRTYNR